MAVLQSYEAPGPLSASRAIVIPPDGTAAAADALHQSGAVKYTLIFHAAAWFTRDQGAIRAGEFLIPAHSSVRDILNILRFGAPVQHQVTIPEGLTGIQVARLINDASNAFGSLSAPPDGSVLPQTYDYTRGTPRTAILQRATAAMQAVLPAAWKRRDRRISLTSSWQAVVLASIVQQETPIAAEMPEIAAVYENRLALGMRLQADPTVIYAATKGASSSGIRISRADLGNPSPYNTYLYTGLPPGPICAPGMQALDAVLHPAASDAMYFVATGTGGHVFSTNYAQHLINVKNYRADQK